MANVFERLLEQSKKKNCCSRGSHPFLEKSFVCTSTTQNQPLTNRPFSREASSSWNNDRVNIRLISYPAVPSSLPESFVFPCFPTQRDTTIKRSPIRQRPETEIILPGNRFPTRDKIRKLSRDLKTVQRSRGKSMVQTLPCEGVFHVEKLVPLSQTIM